jgi:hypothetical protein
MGIWDRVGLLEVEQLGEWESRKRLERAISDERAQDLLNIFRCFRGDFEGVVFRPPLGGMAVAAL